MFVYKDVSIDESSCQSWQQFSSDGLILPFKDIEINSVTLYNINENLINDTVSPVNVTCNQRDAVSYIVGKVVSRDQFQILCDGHIWRQIPCSGMKFYFEIIIYYSRIVITNYALF